MLVGPIRQFFGQLVEYSETGLQAEIRASDHSDEDHSTRVDPLIDGSGPNAKASVPAIDSTLEYGSPSDLPVGSGVPFLGDGLRLHGRMDMTKVIVREENAIRTNPVAPRREAKDLVEKVRASMPMIREDLVEEIQGRIASGSFEAPSHAVAEKIVESMLERRR